MFCGRLGLMSSYQRRQRIQLGDGMSRGGGAKGVGRSWVNREGSRKGYWDSGRGVEFP